MISCIEPHGVGAGLVSALMIVATMLSCDNEIEQTQGLPLHTVTATLPHTGTGTRVGMVYDQTGNQMKVTWAVNDVITVGTLTSEPLIADDINIETGAATFSFAGEPDYKKGITYGTHSTSQIQTANDNYAHLAGVHTMTGTYNDGTISFDHTVSVLRIALSGLRKDTRLDNLDVGNYTLYLGNNNLRTTAEGTFTAWLSMPGGINIKDLTFTVAYGDGEYSQGYTHPFASDAILPPGQLLHCNINMEKQVGTFTTSEGTSWGKPVHTVPGYDYVVYDAASFLAMPYTTSKKIIQVADIEVSAPYSPQFFATYNGNGYTIKGKDGYSDYAFLDIRSNIVNVHTVGIGLVELADGAIISHCSAVGKIMVKNPRSSVFTLCSTDQEKLDSDIAYVAYVACWYNGAVQGDTGTGYVWDESSKEMESVDASELILTDGTINWNYKYVAP